MVNIFTLAFIGYGTARTRKEEDALIKQLSNSCGRPIRSPLLHWPEEAGLDYDTLTFPSADGVPLEAWYIPAKNNSNLLLLVNHPIWFSRSGLPAHLEPWRSIGAIGGNDFEVNFIPDYKNLHDAGYNILVYDMRNLGHSGSANSGALSNGIYESRDVIGALRYIRKHRKLSKMKLGLFMRCCGANAAMIAWKKHPEHFKNVLALLMLQPISWRPFNERLLELLNMTHRLDDMEREMQLITSFKFDQMSPIPYADAVNVPTLMVQVHDDMLTKPNDVQTMFDKVNHKDKSLHWIRGTTRRWDGYSYFGTKNPRLLVNWFDKYMKTLK